MLDNYNVNDELTVHFNLRGREWKSPQGEIKYFNTLEAWRLERKKTESTSAAVEMDATIPTVNDMPFDAKDDLPF